jgi:hypothetical protein
MDCAKHAFAYDDARRAGVNAVMEALEGEVGAIDAMRCEALG